MTFGGEPLLHPEVVCKIHMAAREIAIPKRQLITNGFFSRDIENIHDIAKKLVKSGVNDILLSVDAFHQETIPLELVKAFAKEVKNHNVQIKTHPAWLGGKGTVPFSHPRDHPGVPCGLSPPRICSGRNPGRSHRTLPVPCGEYPVLSLSCGSCWCV